MPDWLRSGLYPRRLARFVSYLVNVRSLLRELRGILVLLRFWTAGGITLQQQLAPREGASRGHLQLLIQPDGDAILSVPRGFGSMEGDAAAAETLFERAKTELVRIARHGFEPAARSLVRALDMVLLWIGGIAVVAAVESGEWVQQLVSSVAALLLVGLRAALGGALRRRLLRALKERVASAFGGALPGATPAPTIAA